MSDAEVIERLGGGSASTIRNHRFTLREKEKQAKLFSGADVVDGKRQGGGLGR